MKALADDQRLSWTVMLSTLVGHPVISSLCYTPFFPFPSGSHQNAPSLDCLPIFPATYPLCELIQLYISLSPH